MGAKHRSIYRPLVALLLCPLPLLAFVDEPPDPDCDLDSHGFSSARSCGRCHEDIYDSWKNSLHAFSLTDPIFDTAYMQAIKEFGDDTRRLCLRCHAPITLVNGDYDLRDGVTREGVTCDFCHTVTELDLERPERPFVCETGDVKRGTGKSPAPTAHGVAHSSIHGTSEFCGACHNFVNEAGTPVMTTYDEWRTGPYPELGVQCQDCHMRATGGPHAMEPGEESGSEYPLHSLIHDSDQLRSALSLEIASAERRRGKVDVLVKIRNAGSGHMVPTGMPSREVVLTVRAAVGDESRTEDRRYRKVLGDETGRILTRDFEAMLRGAKLFNDNRIAPLETRSERFIFPLSGPGPVEVSARLSYRYSPMILDQRDIELELVKKERSIH